MSTKAILALAIVLLLPVLSYLLVDTYSSDAVHMPPRFFPDSTIEKVEGGKKKTDTIWHRVTPLTLTNQLGQKVSFNDVPDKVVVVDFFFTHCPSICPTMTRNMRRLQQTMMSRDPRKVIDTPLAHLMSITIDPKRDSVEVLKKYADKNGVDHNRWWMMTGDQEMIYNFAIREMKLGLVDGNGNDTLFEHSSKLVLLDKDRVIRGYYNGLDTSEILRLSQDIVFLSLEKDRTKPSTIFTQLKELWPVFIVVLLAVGLFAFMSYKSKKKYTV